jgi:hypothetical protein
VASRKSNRPSFSAKDAEKDGAPMREEERRLEARPFTRKRRGFRMTTAYSWWIKGMIELK